MKNYLFIMLCFLGLAACAQNQEIEQLKLNLEKLAQLKLMLSQAKQGYQTLQRGYNAVRDVAKGNYDLHKAYLDGLFEVSAPVRSAPALKRLLDNRTLAEKEYQNWYRQLTSLGLLKAQELFAIQAKYQQIAGDFSEGMDELRLLLMSGKLRMSDAERIAAIETLAGKSDELLAALRGLIKEQTSVVAAKAVRQRDKQAILQLYGLH